MAMCTLIPNLCAALNSPVNVSVFCVESDFGQGRSHQAICGVNSTGASQPDTKHQPEGCILIMDVIRKAFG
jgi:hypothetical protein